MKNKYFMLASLVFLVVVIISFTVYAEKENDGKVTKLPDAVMAVVTSLYPEAQVEEVERDNECVMLYETEVEQGDTDMELSIAPDGTLVEKETEIGMDALPEVIQQALAGADVKEVTEEVAYYVVTLTKLDVPEVSYTVELKTGSEMEFAADGTLLKQEMDDDDGDGRHHKGNTNDKDDDVDDGDEDD